MSLTSNGLPSCIVESCIFQEAQVVKMKEDSKKAIFRMIIQTVDEPNQNKRIYPKAVLGGGMKDCEERMNRRAFYGEMDHPIPIGNETFDSIRQTTVQLDFVSHIITDYEFSGNKLIGEIETLTNTKGKDLFALVRDRTGVGISMRGLAQVNRDGKYAVVESPLLIIGFDMVSLPSHKPAVIDLNAVRFEGKMMGGHVISESKDLVTCDGVQYLANYFDKLVETKMIKFFGSWV